MDHSAQKWNINRATLKPPQLKYPPHPATYFLKDSRYIDRKHQSNTLYTIRFPKIRARSTETKRSSHKTMNNEARVKPLWLWKYCQSLVNPIDTIFWVLGDYPLHHWILLVFSLHLILILLFLRTTSRHLLQSLGGLRESLAQERIRVLLRNT